MLFSENFTFKVMLFKKKIFFKIVLFKIARKMQILRISRGNLNQKVTFCVQSVFQNLQIKIKLFLKNVLFKFFFSKSDAS